MTVPLWKSPAPSKIQIAGVGAYVPPHVVTADQIARAFPGWTAERIVDRTGIAERRYLWPLDVERGCAVSPSPGTTDPTCATDMAEVALTRALAMADLPATELDVLVVVTCTPDQPRFSHDAMALRQRLGIPASAHCMVVDSGCGGSLYVLDMVTRMLGHGAARAAAVVGTNLSSPLVDRGLYGQEGLTGENGKAISPFLSTYVFGDGAGAVVLRAGEPAGGGLVASLAGNGDDVLVHSPGGGTVSPSYGDRYQPIDHAFIVNGPRVATTYLRTMRSSVLSVCEAAGWEPKDVERFYFHQPNDRLLGLLTTELGLSPDQVASNVAHVGNTSSAGMFTLLADDLDRGRVRLGSGAPVVMAAIGAGVHYGAQAVQL